MALRTTGGLLEADRVLLAAGAWTGLLAARGGVPLPLQPAKGYTVTIGEPALQLRRPLYLVEARVACSPFRGALRVGGRLEFAGFDLRVRRRPVAVMGRAATRYLPGWARGAGRCEWAGLRPLAPDGLPLIGRLPGQERVYVATGHGMLGITLAPSTAVAVAEALLTGKADPVLAPFDPRRFVEGPEAGYAAEAAATTDGRRARCGS